MFRGCSLLCLTVKTIRKGICTGTKVFKDFLLPAWRDLTTKSGASICGGYWLLYLLLRLSALIALFGPPPTYDRAPARCRSCVVSGVDGTAFHCLSPFAIFSAANQYIIAIGLSLSICKTRDFQHPN